jgi:ABC-type phosphate/phosphonate transport system substrate-binding protein
VDYVWAARAALPASLRTRIRTAFLSLTMLDSAHVAVLSDQGANGYLPALDADFDTLTAIVRQRAPAAVSKTRKPGTTTR